MQERRIYRPDAEISSDIASYLERQSRKDLLRFITCGSVDDGKSTLIGRLLYESHAVFDDQLSALERDSHLGQGALDFSLLVDGLSAEREQGITIDVAYRFFSTQKRKFIVADTPGHEQYTRNMVTGASTAEAAVILVDARKGVLTQTRRHSILVKLLGIRHVILAVNKMDLVGYSAARFEEISQEYQSFADEIGIAHVEAIPVSALEGENIVNASEAFPWYQGPTLLGALEAVPLREAQLEAPLRLPVQWVNRAHSEFRGFTGQIASGRIFVGQNVQIQPSGAQTQVKAIVALGGDLAEAGPGASVCITLEDEVDCSRGDVICAADAPLEVADQFDATLVWMDEQPMLPGRPYLMKIGTQLLTARVRPPKYVLNVNTGEHLAARTLQLNAIGAVTLSTDRQIPFAPYLEEPQMGAFILIDRETNATVGAGMIRFALRRASNLHWQALDINRAAQAEQKGQVPKLVWFTGLSGAGKSTIANLVQKRLYALGKHSTLLDGDNIRQGLNRDLGFTDADRVENIRRVGEVGRLMVDAGLIVLTAFISPFKAERRMVREMMGPGEFVEVFIDTPLDVAEARDVKGLYRKARAGQLRNFTGIDSPYDPPEAPEIHIRTEEMSPEAAAEQIVALILQD